MVGPGARVGIWVEDTLAWDATKECVLRNGMGGTLCRIFRTRDIRRDIESGKRRKQQQNAQVVPKNAERKNR